MDIEYSRCTRDNEEIAYLKSLISEESYQIGSLIYSGSKHGWGSWDFYDRCEAKGPMVTLMKIDNGDCIGGFSSS